MKLRLFEFYFIKDYLRPWFGLIYSLFFLFFLGAIEEDYDGKCRRYIFNQKKSKSSKDQIDVE